MCIRDSKETIKSPKALQDGLLIVKHPLTDLKLNKKTGEIEGYYQPSSDKLLYEALRARLLEFGGDGKKAFTEPFYKPKSDGTPGPLVRKVKLLSLIHIWFTVGILSTMIGLLFAYVEVYVKIRTKFTSRLFQVVSMLPVVSPPFVLSLSDVYKRQQKFHIIIV